MASRMHPSVGVVMLLLALCAQGVECQASSSRVLGVGVGTLIIIIAVIFSIVWCFACRNSSRP
jgi:Na+/phosphate symporter